MLADSLGAYPEPSNYTSIDANRQKFPFNINNLFLFLKISYNNCKFPALPMANFRTHLTAACAASGMLATTALYTGDFSLQHAAMLWGMGTFGGLLPDIDSDNSTSLSITFILLSIIMAIGLGGYLVSRVPLAYNLSIVTGSLYIIKAIALPLFTKLTVHRGNWHSLSAGLLFTLTVINICHYGFDQEMIFSFLMGISAGGGFIIHLLLDEIYAINFGKASLKKSFGTAFKIIDLSYPISSIILLCLCGLQIYWIPNISPLGTVFNKLASTSLMIFG